MNLSKKVEKLEEAANNALTLAQDMIATLILEPNKQQLLQTDAGKELVRLTNGWFRRLESVEREFREAEQ